MLLYLYGNTRPYVALSMNNCTQYIFIPKEYRELVLKSLASYSKQTKDRGLVLNPNYDVFKVYA